MLSEWKSKKFHVPATILLILTIVGLAVLNREKIGFDDQKTSVSGQKNSNQQQSTVLEEFPVDINSPYVGSVLIHYFFTGKIKEVKTEGTGEIILEKNGSAPELPKLLLQTDTRISKLTPPYGANTTEPIKITDLKPGQTIDISAEYDIRAKQWFMRDVFLQTDRQQ